MMNEARRRAQAKYNKANTKQVTLRLNKRTEADIIEWLEGLDNKQGYIKSLIRADMTRGAEHGFCTSLLEEDVEKNSKNGAGEA